MKGTLSELDVTPDEISLWLNQYTLGENVPGDDYPDLFKGREDEEILSAALPRERFDAVVECAFNRERPRKSAED